MRQIISRTSRVGSDKRSKIRADSITVSIELVSRLMIDSLRSAGCSEGDCRFVVDHYIEAELREKRTHGLVKFLKELQYIENRLGSPQIVLDNASFALVDGNRELGPIAARFCCMEAIARARIHGCAIIGLKNSQRYGILHSWVDLIAANDLIGIVTNSCEPAVRPPYGKFPVLGTNPLAIGIPATSKNIVADFATAKSPMSTLLLVDELPDHTFVDQRGQYTTDKKNVRCVDSFGGFKGYVLSLALECLAGSFIGASMGSEIRSNYDIGYLFVAADPARFGDVLEFKARNQRLLKELLKSARGQFVVPGERGDSRKKKTLRSGNISIPRATLKRLEERAAKP